MTEPKFTPGPWRIGTPPPNGQQTIGTKDGLMVAVATTGVQMLGQTLANAHLIAAAPDLYKTLEWAYTTAVEHDDQDKFDWAIYCERLYQALAKARGESHD